MSGKIFSILKSIFPLLIILTFFILTTDILDMNNVFYRCFITLKIISFQEGLCQYHYISSSWNYFHQSDAVAKLHFKYIEEERRFKY